MYPNQIPPRFARFLILLCSAVFTGCSASPFEAPDRPHLRQSTPGPATTASNPQTLALVGSETISAEHLLPALLELAGDRALAEYLLDRQLTARCAEQGINITRGDLTAERRLLTTALRDDASTDPDQAARLLAALRDRRGLGPARFDALLLRNAMLRRLVAPDIVTTPAMLAQARELRFGLRVTLRVITTASLAEAVNARTLILQGEPFADVAARFSTDISAQRGGLVGPLSLADPAYPQALRDAARTLEPGIVSGSIVLEDSFAIITLVERTTPPAPGMPTPQLDKMLQRDARLRQERLLMDRLARALLAEVRPDVMDASLRFSREAAGN